MRPISLPGELSCTPNELPTLSRFSLDMVPGIGKSKLFTTVHVTAIFSNILQCSGKSIRAKIDFQDLDLIKISWFLKTAAASIIKDPLGHAIRERLLYEKTGKGSLALRRRRKKYTENEEEMGEAEQPDPEIKVSKREAEDLAAAFTRNSFVLDNITLSPTKTSDGYAVDVVYRGSLKVELGDPTHTDIFRITREQYNYVIAKIDDSILKMEASSPQAAEKLARVRDDVELRAIARELHARGHNDLAQGLLGHIIADGDPMVGDQSPVISLVAEAANDSTATGFLLNSVDLPLNISVPIFDLFNTAMNDGWKIGSRLPDSLLQRFSSVVSELDEEDSIALHNVLKDANNRHALRTADSDNDDPYVIAERAARKIVNMLKSRIARSTLVRVILPQMKRISRRLYDTIHSWIPEAFLGKKSEAILRRELENKLKNLPMEDLEELQRFLRRLELGRTATTWDGIEKLNTYTESEIQELFTRMVVAGMLPPLRFAGGKKFIFHDKYETLCLELNETQISASRTYRDTEEDKDFDNLQELLTWSQGSI